MSDRADRRLRLARGGTDRPHRRDPDAPAAPDAAPDRVAHQPPRALTPREALEAVLIVEDALLACATRLRAGALDEKGRREMADGLETTVQIVQFVSARLMYQLGVALDAAVTKESPHD